MKSHVMFLTGAVPGFDVPTICHSGKPRRAKCYAVTREPGREGWVLVTNPPEQRRRNGWWCPDCANQLKQIFIENGIAVDSQNISISPAGKLQ
jgi:hypothetical protein